jgi:F0F1-type ATP synthase alpha subunit
VENLDHIITIVKKLPDDLQMNYAQYKNMKDFMTIETSLAEDNYDMIEKFKN